jgi:hypothetical protein
MSVLSEILQIPLSTQSSRVDIPRALKRLRDEADPLLVGAVGLPTPAASVTEWTVNPSTGDDDAPDGGTLATMRELMRRLRGQRVEQYTLVNLPIGLPAEDAVVSGFDVGTAGFLHFKGTATALQTGTVTAKTDVTPATNTPADITDSALSADWGTLGLIGQRIRMTSGAQTGAISWLLKDLTVKRARVGTWYLSAFANPMPQFFTAGNIGIGDGYAVETLPAIKSLAVDISCSDLKASGKRSTRVLFEDLLINTPAGIGANSIASSTGEGIGFLNCELAGNGIIPVRGGTVAWGCLFGALNIPFGTAAAGLTALGCAVRAGPVSISGTAFITDCVLSDCTYVELFEGRVQLFNTGVIDCALDGLAVWPGGTAQVWSQLWGAGNGGYGLKVYSGGTITPYTGVLALVTITGSSGDTIVGATPRTHAQLPYIDPTTNAMIVEHS